MEIVDLCLRNLPLMLIGFALTIKVLLVAAAISLFLGLLLGIVCSDEMKIPFVSSFFYTISFVLRAVPFYLQLLIVYFVFPDLLGINLNVFTASVLSLGLCSAGYVCQIVRAGINSIPVAQWEAALVLGYSKMGTLRYVILPQMFHNVLPALNNEFESMLKSTSILSSIGMLELTRMGMNIVSREMESPLAIYLFVALFYLVTSVVFNYLAAFFEKKMKQKIRVST